MTDVALINVIIKSDKEKIDHVIPFASLKSPGPYRKPKRPDNRPQPCTKDLQTLSLYHHCKPVPFTLFHKRRPILREDPNAVLHNQSIAKAPRHPDFDEVLRTRPRLVMTPAVIFDDMNAARREPFIKNIYLSSYQQNYNKNFSDQRIVAPLPDRLSVAKPIYLPKVKAYNVPFEWRKDTLTWEGKQLRTTEDINVAFWSKKNLYENGAHVLTETCLAALTTGCRDSDSWVRATSLRALRHSRAAVDLAPTLALLSQAVDAEKSRSPIDNIPLAAVESLCYILSTLNSLPANCESELLVLSQKIRPFFNTDCPLLREHSIRLFGIIAERVKPGSLLDQSMASLPCFLIHLCDTNADVVKASKLTLKRVFQTLGTPDTNSLVQTHLVEEGRLFLPEFLSALLRRLMKERPEGGRECLQTAGYYLAGKDKELVAAAASLVGKLYAEIYNLRKTSPQHCVVDAEVTRNAHNRLLLLIKHDDSDIRQNAAYALAYLCLCNNEANETTAS